MTVAARALEAWYVATGRRAWSVGYAEHKLRSIRAALASKISRVCCTLASME